MVNQNETFWDYSIQTYEKLSSPFIFLQDHAGLDVNLLLFCCWVGQAGRVLSDKQIILLCEKVLPVRDNLIIPLRKARKFAKTLGVISDAEHLKNNILLIELEAERVEQAILLDTLGNFSDECFVSFQNEAENIVANLKIYLSTTSVDFNGETKAALTTLIKAIFPKPEKCVSNDYWQKIIDKLRESS